MIAINVTPHSTLSKFTISTSYEGYKDQQTTRTKEGRVICHVRITISVDQVSENSCRSFLTVLSEDANPRSIQIEDHEDKR